MRSRSRAIRKPPAYAKSPIGTDADPRRSLQPGGSGDDPALRKKFKDDWHSWWKSQEANVDLAKLEAFWEQAIASAERQT